MFYNTSCSMYYMFWPGRNTVRVRACVRNYQKPCLTPPPVCCNLVSCAVGVLLLFRFGEHSHSHSRSLPSFAMLCFRTLGVFRWSSPVWAELELSEKSLVDFAIIYTENELVTQGLIGFDRVKIIILIQFWQFSLVLTVRFTRFLHPLVKRIAL